MHRINYISMHIILLASGARSGTYMYMCIPGVIQCSHQDLTAKSTLSLTSLDLPMTIPSYLKCHYIYIYLKGHLASMALAKGHMSGSKGHCALWKTPSENTGVIVADHLAHMSMDGF